MKRKQWAAGRVNLVANRRSIGLGSVGFFAGLMFVGLVSVSPAPSAAADDAFPRGCVSCHVVLDDGEDKRLSAVLGELGHLALKGKVARVPADCITCHGKKVDTPFSVLIHQAHFGSPDRNVFIQRFGGDCRACHVMDATTGKAKLKEGDNNW